MTVLSRDGSVLGRLNDVRLAPTRKVQGVTAELVVDGLVVADRHAGSLLGYDRRSAQGPWLVRRAVQLLHRGAGYAPWSAVTELDWEGRTLTLAMAELEPLSRP
jgi:hypothetical protein